MAFEVGFFVVVFCRAGRSRAHCWNSPEHQAPMETLRNFTKWSAIWPVSCSEAPRASVLMRVDTAFPCCCVQSHSAKKKQESAAGRWLKRGSLGAFKDGRGSGADGELVWRRWRRVDPAVLRACDGHARPHVDTSCYRGCRRRFGSLFCSALPAVARNSRNRSLPGAPKFDGDI